MSSKGGKGRSRRKVVDSWKLKEWYEVYAPKSFKELYVGQIPSADPENLIGRTIEIRLFDLTKDFRQAHIKIKYKVTNVNGLRCESQYAGHELTTDFIRALVHRGSTRVDGIFDFKTADGFIYRVSTFVVTRRRIKNTQKHTIRTIIYQVLNEFAKSSNHGKFIRGVIYGKYAENISNIAKTIYPLKECQIRKTKLISFPEGIVDEEYDEDEMFEEQKVELKQHGKQIRGKKRKPKSSREEGEFEEISEDTDKPEKKEEKIDEDAVENIEELIEEAEDSTDELSEKEKKKLEKEKKKAEKKAKKDKKE